ncbi:LysR family transcriptional regulator [Paenibacillus riograndensis]|uniref:LysR family transcriptional regulator n=1 Tax=Paenibacillus riograndensis TaxID=483937 RepID=A0A132TNM7_9BACL|nr:LysR family transcriptional regulator [Paenibacillus riograndensis]KWX72952.1 LysR family transcriptional regulator [Paenibacillus riograndensis]
MDIKHLEYFIEIVNSSCNLSVAAKKLCVTQPSLSLLIKNFEDEENVNLFERYKGRLQNLTPAGERFFENAKILVKNYQNMLAELREDSFQFKGKIVIGIPPLILGIVFADILSGMLSANPDIKFEIIEAGAYELRRMLTLKELDFAILLQPTNIDPTTINEYLLQEDELTAFMSSSNPLANHEKIHWKQLNNEPLAIFNHTFMIHHKLLEQFKKENIQPQISILSASWDFLLQVTKRSKFITILPSPVHDFFNVSDIIEVPFHQPITWKVILCQPAKDRYSHVERHVKKIIIDHFAQNSSS